MYELTTGSHSTFRSIGVAACISLGVVASVMPQLTWAQDLIPKPENQETFDDQVRAALLRNPEIMLEVFALLEAEQISQEAQSDIALINEHSDALFGPDFTPDQKVLVEFFDYSCGYCKAVAPIVEAVLVGDPEIRRVAMQFPILGEKSMEAASVMIAVRNMYGLERFENLHVQLMTGDPRGLQTLPELLEANGLDADALFIQAASSEVQDEIAANIRLARALGINGTPGFVTPSAIMRGFVQEGELISAIRGS